MRTFNLKNIPFIEHSIFPLLFKVNFKVCMNGLNDEGLCQFSTIKCFAKREMYFEKET